MIFFFNKNTGKIHSYIQHELKENEVPSKQICATVNNYNIEDLQVAELLISNLLEFNFPDNISSLNEIDYRILG